MRIFLLTSLLVAGTCALPADYYHHSSYPAPHAAATSYGHGGHHGASLGAHNDGHYGYKDHYGADAYNNHGHKKYDDYASVGAHHGHHADHNSGYGAGLYSRNRGYGYEKHYAYDKELSSQKQAHDIGSYGGHGGHHKVASNHGDVGYGAHGYHKEGDHAKYGAHSAGKYGHSNGGYDHSGYGKQVAYVPAPVATVVHHAPYHGYGHGYDHNGYSGAAASAASMPVAHYASVVPSHAPHASVHHGHSHHHPHPVPSIHVAPVGPHVGVLYQ